MRLWLENEQLRAATLAEFAALRASRRRIIQQADKERRRLERDLHDGAQQRVLGLGLLLHRLRGRLTDTWVEVAAQAEHHADAALDELRRIARGIHPELLSPGGLRGALADLADAAPDLAVRLDVVLERRYPAAVELAAYLVVAEMLADAREGRRGRPAGLRRRGRVAAGGHKGRERCGRYAARPACSCSATTTAVATSRPFRRLRGSWTASRSCRRAASWSA